MPESVYEDKIEGKRDRDSQKKEYRKDASPREKSQLMQSGYL